jgi:hypothetical protein
MNFVVLKSIERGDMPGVKSFRQNGEQLVVTETKLNHQRRQIIRRDARRKAKAGKVTNVPTGNNN